MPTTAVQQASQRRAVEGPSGSPHSLTLEVDTDYYEALEGSDYDWQAVARSRTGTRVHWADSVVSPAHRRHKKAGEYWHDESIAGVELHEYSSWQISLGIANERAALTSPGQPSIDEFAPWQQRLGLQAALEEQERAAGAAGDATPLPRGATGKWRDYDPDINKAGCDAAIVTSLLDQRLAPHSDGATTPNRQSAHDTKQSPSFSTGMPRSPRFSFRRRNSSSALTSGKKKSILRDRSRHQPRPVASSASFASPRWRSQDPGKGHMRPITNRVELS